MQNEANQIVTSPVIFNGNVVVRDMLTTYGPVNNLDMTKMVTTITDQNLTATYTFNNKTEMNKNIIIDGLINDVINITHWNAKSFKDDTNVPKALDNMWIFDKNVSFNGNVHGNSLIGDLNLTDLAAVVENKRLFKNNVEQNLIVSLNQN